MEASILDSTKKILGVPDDYTAFDTDIITHINSAFAVVSQIGVGPTHGFAIEDSGEKWEDLALPADQLGLLKTLIFLKTQMLFDPPATSFLIGAKNDQIEELTTRLSWMREAELPLVPSEDLDEPVVIPGDSASGAVLTPAYVWVMDHNLHFFPAAVKCWELDTNEELEPEEIQYINNNRVLALWPVPIAGRWRVS